MSLSVNQDGTLVAHSSNRYPGRQPSLQSTTDPELPLSTLGIDMNTLNKCWTQGNRIKNINYTCSHFFLSRTNVH